MINKNHTIICFSQEKLQYNPSCQVLINFKSYFIWGMSISFQSKLVMLPRRGDSTDDEIIQIQLVGAIALRSNEPMTLQSNNHSEQLPFGAMSQ